MTRVTPALARTVRAAIRRHDLLLPGGKVIVAVSGGIDSMVLLDLLASLEEYRLDLTVAHLNHLLRGDEAERDEELVREVAARYGLPSVVSRVAVREMARSEKRSLEDAGREARHRFLEELLRSTGGDAVALAHHRDDQAETVLMRLLRGSGATGLAGMSPRSGWKIRPLLDASREEIAAYAEYRKIPFREDGSNQDRRFLRNRVRHDLLPLLTSYNPLVSRTLGATALLLAADDEVLTAMAEQRFALLATISGGEVTFPVAGLLHEPDAVRFRIYRRAIRDLNGDLRAISYRHLSDVDRLLSHDIPSSAVTLPRSLCAGRVYDSLRFFRHETAETGDEVRIGGSGDYPVTGGTLSVSPASLPFHAGSLPPTGLIIDLDGAPFPWSVRTFREGDRMVPFGMTGSRKLKDIFIDQKVPRHRRREIPLLCDGEGRILAIVGVRRSALAPVTATTRQALLVRFLEADAS